MKAKTQLVVKSLIVAAVTFFLTWGALSTLVYAEGIEEEEIEVVEEEGEPQYVTQTFEAQPFQTGEPGQESDAAAKQTYEAFTAAVTAGLESVAPSIDVTGLGMSPDEVTRAFQDFVNANQKFFYVSTQVSIDYCEYPGGDQVAEAICPSYMYDAEEIPAKREEYEAAVAQVMSWVPEGADDATKAKAVHDWLVRNCAYCAKAVNMSYDDYVREYGTGPWNSYGALVDKVAVCRGYSLAYADVLTRLGVPCQYVMQESAEHSWNRVCINGHWYHVDVSWDDPLTARNADAGFDAPVSAAYFLKSDSWMQKDARTDVVKTHATWSPEGTASDDASYDNKTDWPTFSGPAQRSSSIELEKQSVPYTGKAIEYSGKVTKTGSTGEVTYEYFLDAECKKKATPKEMGTYYVRATLAEDANYKAATSKPVTLTITR